MRDGISSRSIAVIQEAYVQGVSTRSVDDLLKAMGGLDV
jgi:transposase-like protein